jgi:hypothetical protein
VLLPSILAGLLLAACAAEMPVAPVVATAAAAESDPQTNYSLSIQRDGRVVYARIVRARSQGSESLSRFVERVFTSVDRSGARQIVLDVSKLEGGDAFLLTPLVRGIVSRSELQRHGGIVVIAGSETYTARQNLVRILRSYADPIVVGRVDMSLSF